jgi:hypothetical protein
MYKYDNISQNSSQNNKYFRQNSYRKSKHTLYVQYIFSVDRAVYEARYSSPITRLDSSVVLQEIESPRMSRHSAYEGGKVASLMHRDR